MRSVSSRKARGIQISAGAIRPPVLTLPCHRGGAMLARSMRGGRNHPPNRVKEEIAMSSIERYDVNEQWAHSGIIKAGDLYFVGYCVGNIGQDIEMQVRGALDHLERRLSLVGLTLEHVVQMDCLFRDVWNIPVMEKVIKERFHGKYPVRKSIQTAFAHTGGPDGLQFQLDAVAYGG